VHDCGALLRGDFASDPWELGTSCDDRKELRTLTRSL